MSGPWEMGNVVQTNVRECGMLCRKASGDWKMGKVVQTNVKGCLLYTSDAADES